MIAKLLKNKNLRLVLISVILGLVAALLVKSYVTDTIFTRTGGRVVPVVVATSEIPAGSVIKAEQLGVVTIPEAYLHVRAVRAESQSFLVGQTAAVDMIKGEGIEWTDMRLAPEATLGDRLDLNQRAVTVRVDQTGALNGMIQPGNRVDVLCQMRGSKSGAVMHMVAQNMTILAVGDRLTANNSSSLPKKGDTQDNSISSVTFRTSPEGAMLLSYAESQGRITLILRNDMDIISEPLQDIGASSLVTMTPGTQVTDPKPAASSEYPTIYVPGQLGRVGNSPGDQDLINELKQMKPEDAKKRLLEELAQPSPGPK
jgi:pilus assembly protein CpaB